LDIFLYNNIFRHKNDIKDMITKLYIWFQIPDDDSSSPRSIGLVVVIA